jgi:hypothetical protein
LISRAFLAVTARFFFVGTAWLFLGLCKRLNINVRQEKTPITVTQHAVSMA